MEDAQAAPMPWKHNARPQKGLPRRRPERMRWFQGRQIAAKYGRGLDDLSVKEKIRIFKATKVDFDIGPLDKGKARGKRGGKKGR